jgi:hypothetical protein
MSQCEYVTIEYYPKTFNDEHINVAFALHDPVQGRMYFTPIKNYHRVTAFDDEIAEDDFKNLLASVQSYFESPFAESLLPKRNDNLIYSPDFFDENRHVFLNQFRLSKTLYCETKNPKETCDLLSKVALFYDHEKKDRPSSQEVAKAVRMQIESAFKANAALFHRMPIEDEMTRGESIRFDYRYQNTYIKIFNILGQDKRDVIEQAKVWFYNANYFAGKEAKLLLVVPDETGPEDKAFSSLVFNGLLQGINAEIVHSSDFPARLKEIQN